MAPSVDTAFRSFGAAGGNVSTSVAQRGARRLALDRQPADAVDRADDVAALGAPLDRAASVERRSRPPASVVSSAPLAAVVHVVRRAPDAAARAAAMPARSRPFRAAARPGDAAGVHATVIVVLVVGDRRRRRRRRRRRERTRTRACESRPLRPFVLMPTPTYVRTGPAGDGPSSGPSGSTAAGRFGRSTPRSAGTSVGAARVVSRRRRPRPGRGRCPSAARPRRAARRARRCRSDRAAPSRRGWRRACRASAGPRRSIAATGAGERVDVDALDVGRPGAVGVRRRAR